MHDIQQFLDARGRTEAVRGRMFAYSNIEPEKTALVIVDMQNVFCAPGQVVEVPTTREIVPNINALTDAARASGMTVVWLKQTLGKDAEQGWPIFFQFGMLPEQRETFNTAMTPGNEGHEIYSELNVAPSDVIIQKRCFSAFAPGSSPIDSVLRERGIHSLIICGTVTNVCCESTARDAYFQNYRQIFTSDATAAFTDEEHNATLLSMHSFFADVRSTREILDALKHNEHQFTDA